MSVVVSVEDSGASKKQVTVEVPAEEIERATREVTRAYAQQARIPGFRQGKVPAELVRRRFREEIEREVVERLVPRFWEQARQEQGLRPLGEPRLEEVGTLADGEPLRFVASVEVRPDITLGDTDTLELPEPEIEPSDEEVDQALDELRHSAGEWRATDRPAARGDLVAARIREDKPETAAAEAADEDAEDDGGADEGAEAADAEPSAAGDDAEAGAVPAPEPEGDRVEVEVGDPRVWEELSLALTGLTVGQEGRFTRAPEGEAAPRSFRFQVEAVQERDLPPLDDALAARLGDFDSVDALRTAVRDRLRQQKTFERGQKRREALLTELRLRHPVVLPEGVVEHETHRLLNDFAEDMAGRGLDPREAQIDWREMGERLRPAAERRVHERLLLDAAAEREGVEVTDADVEDAVAAIAAGQKTSPAQVRSMLGDGGLVNVREQIRRERALKRLLGEDDAGPGAGGEGDEVPETAAATGRADV